MAVQGLDEIVVDCADPVALAGFWAAVFGVNATIHSETWTYIDVPGATTVAFQKVPETKTSKNRLHLDVKVDEIAPEADRLVALGATRFGEVRADPPGRFQVMIDPEGNEFCLVQHP
jgi:predicted enzyme related to lactoylglutathione lyase